MWVPACSFYYPIWTVYLGFRVLDCFFQLSLYTPCWFFLSLFFSFWYLISIHPIHDAASKNDARNSFSLFWHNLFISLCLPPSLSFTIRFSPVPYIRSRYSVANSMYTLTFRYRHINTHKYTLHILSELPRTELEAFWTHHWHLHYNVCMSMPMLMLMCRSLTLSLTRRFSRRLCVYVFRYNRAHITKTGVICAPTHAHMNFPR